jgi:hypothetical protein
MLKTAKQLVTAGAGQQVTIGVVDVAAAPAQRRDDRVEPLVELVNSHAELRENVLVVHAAGWGPKQHVLQYFAVEPVHRSSLVVAGWAILDHGRAAFQWHEALCRRVDLKQTGDVLELCTLSQRHSRHAFRRAEHLVAERRLVDIVLRRLAAILDAFRARQSDGNTQQSAPSDASHQALTLWVSPIHVLSQSLKASAIVSKVPSQ